MPYVQDLYTLSVGHWIPGLLLRGLACAIAFCPHLYDGSHPAALARWIEQTPQAASWWGFFYGGNIAGGVIGCLGAGFYLLRVFDMATASYVAAAINIAVAAISLALARVVSYKNEVETESSVTARPAAGSSSVFVAIALSGLCALGAEVV